MKYLLLAFGDEAEWRTRSPVEREQFREASRAVLESLRADGYLEVTEAVQGSETAATLGVCGGTRRLGDGPLVPNAEQLNRLILIRARDFSEAVQIAAKLPQARHGSIEIRPVADDPPGDFQ